MAIHIPKGEGIKIIKQYSEATTNDSIYILPIDDKYAEMVIVDKVGGKRKVGFSLPENLALHDIVNSDGEITTRGNTYLKSQIDTLLNNEKTAREEKDTELEIRIQSETRARESKDNELITDIEAEQQERATKIAEINESISVINNELNAEKTTREQADISLDGKINNLKSIVDTLSDWKNLMVNEDADAIINTITEVVSAFKNLPEGSNVLELLNTKVNIASIVNNLESELENAPLSAKQGKVLKDLIADTKVLLEQKNTTQDTAISGKLDKTTATITEPNAEFKYAYLTNERNETRRMLAGDLGKNVANSKPTSVAGAGLNMGAIWEIATNGFPLMIKGLANKKYDPTHNLKVKMNANGQLSVSDEMDVVVNIPDKFNSTASIGSMTINVNHIFPNPIPPTLNFAEEIKEIMRQYPSYEFTPITKSMWQIQTKNNLGLDRIILGDDNTVLLQGSTDFNGMNNELVASVFTPNLRLPRDKNWILKFDFETLQSRFGGLYFGVCRYGNNNNNNNNNNNVVYGFESGGWDFHGQELKVRILLDSTKTLPYSKGTALLIKVGETITQVIYCYDTNTYKTVSATTELGDYVPCLNLLGADGTLTPNRRMKAKAYYKILD